jgi:hypothetical protein
MVLTAIMVMICNGGVYVRAYGLLDGGSTDFSEAFRRLGFFVNHIFLEPRVRCGNGTAWAGYRHMEGGCFLNPDGARVGSEIVGG